MAKNETDQPTDFINEGEPAVLPDEGADRLHREWEAWRKKALGDIEPSRLNELERAWAAGLFDGEGHARADVPDDLETASPKPLLAIKQAYGKLGLYNLKRFQEAVGGAGSIRGPYETKTQPLHVWQARSEDDVDKVWAAIGPFLGPAKFAQFRDALGVPLLRDVRENTYGTRRRERPGVVGVDIAKPDASS